MLLPVSLTLLVIAMLFLTLRKNIGDDS